MSQASPRSVGAGTNMPGCDGSTPSSVTPPLATPLLVNESCTLPAANQAAAGSTPSVAISPPAATATAAATTKIAATTTAAAAAITAPPLSDEHIAQLARFNLRLIDHPRILLCTLSKCSLTLPLNPTVKDITNHMKTEHGRTFVDSAAALLPQLLTSLGLQSPSDVAIDMDKLPANFIKGLDIIYSGYRCKLCEYAIKTKSTMYAHLRAHSQADPNNAALSSSVNFWHPVPLQLIYECGQQKRYLHVRNQQLDSTPPPPLFTTTTEGALQDATVKAKAEAFLLQDQERMEQAGVNRPVIQASSFHGNLNPWAKRLGWHVYWSGKAVTVIGSLGKDPQHWPGAHRSFITWLQALASRSCQAWMSGLVHAGSQVQQMFRAYGPDASHPYDLSWQTIKKRADQWAHLLALLAHIVFDGSPGYYGTSDTASAHLGLNEDIQLALADLRDHFNTLDDDMDITKDDDDAVRIAQEMVLELSQLLVTQQPEIFGRTEELTVVRLFLHLCLSNHGTPKLVTACTSIIASLEFAMRSVLHEHLLDPIAGKLADVNQQELCAKVEAKLKLYMHATSNSASAHLQSLLRYGTVLSQDDGSALTFTWSRDCTSVAFGTERIMVTHLQSLMQGACHQACTLLHQLCLLKPDSRSGDSSKPKLDDNIISHLKDNLRNMQPGFNFAKANGYFDPHNILRSAILGHAATIAPLMDTFSDELEFDPVAAQSYFAIHNEFTKLLAVLIELGSGLPARGTELIRLQHTNTLAGPRNIFVYDGYVFTVLPSIKGTGHQKLIPRFLPYNIGFLVVMYVAQVVPFVHLLYNRQVQPRAACAMLLADHAGKTWDTNTITKTLQSLYIQYVSSSSANGLSMRSWRQLAVSIDRKLIRPQHHRHAKESLEDDVHDLQAGHSTNTAEQHYGLDASMLRQLTQESMDAMLVVSQRWHAFWEMRSCPNAEVKEFSSLLEVGSRDNHSKVLAAIKRKLEQMDEDVQSIKQSVKRKLDHHLHSPEGATPPRCHQADSSSSAVLPLLVSTALHKVTGSYSTKTPTQAIALKAIHQEESPLIIIMPTGSGKSALFMAPLHWLPPASVVVVVVPYIALTEDLMQQCHRVGISASQWSGYRCTDKVEGSQLVFVAVEHCYSQTFGNWAQELVQQKQLAAIFFDECHVCITQDSFRSSMDKIKALITSIPTRKYFLTATLPPHMVSTFKDQLHLPQGTHLLRDATNRKNISYAVQRLPSPADLKHALDDLIASSRYGAIMVFCKTKDAAQQTAERLGCKFISSDMDGKSKAEILSAWLQCSASEEDNSFRVLVGTTAIGTGINPPYVSLVVHLSHTWDLISYVQESGRAGRSGQPASAVLLVTQTSICDAQVGKYVEETSCRRSVLSTYMDGRAVSCLSRPDFALCDLCKQHIGPQQDTPRKTVCLETPPRSEKASSQAGSSTHASMASSSRLNAITAPSASALPESPTPQRSQQTVLESPIFLPVLRQSGQQVPPPAISSIQPPPHDGNVSRTVHLLQEIAGGCSLCYFFRHQHSCIGEHGPAHTFKYCDCWPEIEPLLPLSLQGKINETYIGNLKRAMGEKARGIACYSCLLPLRICHSSSSASASIRGCTRRYADIVLPIVAVVLRHKELRIRVLAKLGQDDMDLSALEVNLGKAVVYQQQKVFLAYAIFAAAVEMEL